MKRVGIYPGTFDPIHRGHVAFAREALKQLQLDEVIFLPEDRPRGKQNVTSRNKRMLQIKAELRKYDNLRAVEIESGSFTVQRTLPHLQELFPDTQLTLLIGSDVMRGLESWQDIEKLLRQMSLAIGMRTGSQKGDAVDIIHNLERQHDLFIDYRCIYTPYHHVASTQLRSIVS